MDSQLLHITTIPISIEINITNATHEYKDDISPKVDVTTEKGGLRIEAQPTKLNVDTYAARASLGYGNMKDGDMLKKEAQKGFSFSYQGTARIVQDGNQLARGVKPSEIAIQKARAGATVETIMEFLPSEGADITFNEGKLNINYTMDKTEFDWNTMNSLPMEFVPGSVELIVKNRPRVEIEYMGEPMYVPPSANPNYEPPLFDVKG